MMCTAHHRRFTQGNLYAVCKKVVEWVYTHTVVGKLTSSFCQVTEGDGSPRALHSRRILSPTRNVYGDGPGLIVITGKDWISSTATAVTFPASFSAVHV